MSEMTKALNGIDEYIELLEERYRKTVELYETEVSKLVLQRDTAIFERDSWKERAETPWELYKGAIEHVANERDEALALVDELKKNVKHWRGRYGEEKQMHRQTKANRDEAQALVYDLEQSVKQWQDNFDKEHAAFVQAADERDMFIRKLDEQRKISTHWRNRAKKLEDHAKALEFIDSIAEMIACDCELSDIADEFVAWRKGEWTPEPSDPYRWAVYVVEEKGDERVFTGFFADYDKARESVDLMVARGCYEAWVEDKHE